MAGQAILGETILDQAKAKEALPNSGEMIEDLVAQHALLVFRIAYSILRNHHDAEDAAQDCFLRVLKARKQLIRVRNPKTWLARVAWTTALDRRARRPAFRGTEHPRGQEALGNLADGSVAADQRLAEEQTRQTLERLVRGLPEDLRRPLELSTVQELTCFEIAEIMEIPESSVRTRLLRARKMLKEKFAALEVART